MKWLLFTFSFLSTVFVQAQSFQLSYEGMPELYNTIDIYLFENGKEVAYNARRSPYELSTTQGVLRGNTLTINYNTLYENNGTIQFLLRTKQEEHQIELSIPIIKELRFNLYSDSIKPVLNYYVNVEGVFTNGNIFPLDTSMVTISSDVGKVNGLEWIKPKKIDFDYVDFVAVCKQHTTLTTAKKVYIKKGKED